MASRTPTDPDPARPPTIMDRLRQETRPQHESIERVVPLLSQDLTLQSYQRYLRGLWGFHRPLEPLLQRHLDALPAFELSQRRKLPALEQDLLALGQAAPSLAALPCCHRLPQITSAAGALGCLYVLEGATLGGQILLRRVAAELGLGPERGAAYLAAYGARTGEMWRRFRGALCDHADLHGGEAPIIQAAQETFSALEAWLRPATGGP